MSATEGRAPSGETGLVRAFIALPIEPAARSELGVLQHTMRVAAEDAGWKARWPPPDNLHLTLAFLGDVAPAPLASIMAALPPIGLRPRFAMTFDRLGAFPEHGRPKVLWAGVGVGAVEVDGIALDLRRCLTAIDFPLEDRAFVAHVTLARVRHARGTASRVLGAVSRFAPVTSLVREVVLYRSHLEPTGALHEPLARFPLAPTDAPV